MKRIFGTILVTVFAFSAMACGEEYYDEEFLEYYENEAENAQSDDYEDAYYYTDEDEDSDYSSQRIDWDGGEGTQGDEYSFPYDTSLGTARELKGDVAIITVFVDDETTSWDFDNEADAQMGRDILTYTSIATDYIENECERYGRNVNFIYDWTEHPELAYELDTNLDYRYMEDDQYGYYTMGYDVVGTQIPTASILESVGCDQVVYILYFNTPETNDITSRTMSYVCNQPASPYEIVYMFMRCRGFIECPANIAHEILHTFGAPDLYYAGDYGITQEYVDYVQQSGLNDIMRTNDDPSIGNYNYTAVKNDITDITAYYLGLVDYSETVDKWGFGPNQY